MGKGVQRQTMSYLQNLDSCLLLWLPTSPLGAQVFSHHNHDFYVNGYRAVPSHLSPLLRHSTFSSLCSPLSNGSAPTSGLCKRSTVNSAFLPNQVLAPLSQFQSQSHFDFFHFQISLLPQKSNQCLFSTLTFLNNIPFTQFSQKFQQEPHSWAPVHLPSLVPQLLPHTLSIIPAQHHDTHENSLFQLLRKKKEKSASPGL